MWNWRVCFKFEQKLYIEIRLRNEKIDMNQNASDLNIISFHNLLTFLYHIFLSLT